ncbi:MAG: vitamin K epoxide reductase family protein [Desulfobulbus oligotrophicus]|jgi:uncharacterized membrane protein/protein-disulfide isomerase|nr:vitamin K epoxide reductase family protein [Desulfobulbus oligotrophicus]
MKPAANRNKTTPWPYHWYTVPVLFLLLLGLIDSGYLGWLHYKNYTDITFSSFCALSTSINCDTVSQSPWSILFGLPLAVWGIFAYLVFLVLFLPVFRHNQARMPIWYVLLTLAFSYSAFSIYLGFISATRIHAHCILCMASYAISFLLLIYSFIIIRRFCGTFSISGLIAALRTTMRSPLSAAGLPVLFAAFVLVKMLLPSYWHYTLPAVTEEVAHGLTEEGHPWIGAANPQLTIHEYTDYQCFQCGKMHQFLRRLVAEHPDTIRLVHHHYPMDHEFNTVIVPEPFHVGSGKMAMLAIYAVSQNKFWAMNDALYELGREKQAFSTKTLADKTGISAGELTAAIQYPPIRNALLVDIRLGMKLHITGTPSYVIDGEVYTGSIPPEILKTALQPSQPAKVHDTTVTP